MQISSSLLHTMSNISKGLINVDLIAMQKTIFKHHFPGAPPSNFYMKLEHFCASSCRKSRHLGFCGSRVEIKIVLSVSNPSESKQKQTRSGSIYFPFICFLRVL